MFCKYCGAQLSDAMAFCTNCGAHREESPTQSAAQPAPPLVTPVPSDSYYQRNYSDNFNQAYEPPTDRKTNGLAIASFIVSLVSICLCCFPSIIGLILGIIAALQIRDRGDKGKGFAIAAIIIGAVCTVIFALLVIGMSADGGANWKELMDLWRG